MMTSWKTLKSGERVALGLFALLVLSIMIHDWMIRSIWVLWYVPLALLGGSGVLLAVFNFGVGLRDGLDWPDKLRSALAVPLALIGAALLSVLGVGRVLEASVFLIANQANMEVAQPEAGPGQPAALRYIEGVPDGGVAIIRSPVPPRALPVKVQMRLTGERIRTCRPILFAAYPCTYD